MPSIRIASPCSANWNQMAGDDRVRYCEDCKLHVFNFSEMTPAEVNRIIAITTGRVCARFYQRSDGTMITKDCPVGFRGVILRASGIAATVLTAIFSLGPENLAAKLPTGGFDLIQIQAPQNSFSVQVLDPAGAVIVNASVKLVNEKSKIKLEGKTDATGKLSLPNIPDGLYDLSIVSDGFFTFKQTRVQAPAPHVLTVTLRLGVMGDVVVLSEEASHAPVGSTLEASKPQDVSKAQENHNAIRNFFAKLGHLF